jgi:hypothetical protein
MTDPWPLSIPWWSNSNKDRPAGSRRSAHESAQAELRPLLVALDIPLLLAPDRRPPSYRERKERDEQNDL